MTNFSWKVKKTNKNNKARTGKISTPHGDIETPAFIFCAQKIKAGVSISPCGVEIFPVLALLFLFVFLTFQEKLVISFWDKKLSYINKRSVK